MKTSYETTVLGFGNHAAIEIPEKNIDELGGSKRLPLKITINGYTYQSTSTVSMGKCLVVFPTKDREASGAKAGDTVMVYMELDNGHRNVDVPKELQDALSEAKLDKVYNDLAYSRRKEYARLVADAKADDTKQRRIEKILNELTYKNH